MLDEIRDIDASTLDDLSRLKEEQALLRQRVAAMDERRGSVSDVVFARVQADYERRLADLADEARPLKEAAAREYARLEALCAGLAEAQAEARLACEEIEFRHELGEFEEEEHETLRVEAQEELGRRDEALAEAEALRQRFLDAVESPDELASQGPAGEEVREGDEATDEEGVAAEAGDAWAGVPSGGDVEADEFRPASSTAAGAAAWVRSGGPGAPTGSGAGLPPPPPGAAPSPVAEPAGPGADRTLIASTVAGASWHEPSGSGPAAEPDAADAGAAGDRGSGGEADDVSATLRPGQLAAMGYPAAAPGGETEGDAVGERSEVESTQATRIIAQPRLVTVEGGRAGQSFVLRPGVTTTIGRSSDNLVHFLEEAVSRRHAEVVPGPDGYLLRDLGSENGIYVNGKRKKEHVLAEGDIVQIGVRKLVFHEV